MWQNGRKDWSIYFLPFCHFNRVKEVNAYMNNEEAQFVSYIKRTIDGRTYTVLIHFKKDAKETAKGKLKKLIKNDLSKKSL